MKRYKWKNDIGYTVDGSPYDYRYLDESPEGNFIELEEGDIEILKDIYNSDISIGSAKFIGSLIGDGWEDVDDDPTPDYKINEKEKFADNY